MGPKTPERTELLCELWGQPHRSEEILERINALPGDPVAMRHIWNWARKSRVKRCPEMVALVLGERNKTRRFVPIIKAYEAPPPLIPARDMQFGSLVFTPDWPRELVIELIDLWNTGTTTLLIQHKLQRSKNALIGKIHRLAHLNLVTLRQSPVIRDLNDPRRTFSLNRRNVPRPKITLTPVRREVPLIITPASRATEAKRVVEPSPFDNMIYRPPSVAPVQAFVPPSRKCCYPLWGDSVKPDHRYCDEPAVIRSYCARHAKACYIFVRQIRDAA